MIKKYAKHYLISIFLIGCFICVTTQCLAQPSINDDLQKISNSLENIQKQLSYVSENAFVNSVQKNDSTLLKQNLTVLSNELTNLENDLKNYTAIESLTKAQGVKLYRLANSAIFLKLISENLLYYLNSTDPTEQYTLLQDIMQLNSVVTLLLNTA